MTDIPARTRIHRVIHVSLLKPYRARDAQSASTTSDAYNAPPPVPRDPVLGQPDAASTDTQEDILFHVERFIDSRWFGKATNRVVKYRVRWQGYKPAEDTWQTIEESGWPASPDILQAYRAFHDAYPR